MIVRDLLNNSNIVYPTTIIKLLLCKNIIDNFVNSFSNMKNQGTIYNDELFNSHKKFEILKSTLKSNEMFFIDGWSTPNGIIGPYLINREIIFFNKIEKLLLIFTHFPIHSINPCDRSDVMIREIKSYVYDNIEWVTPPNINKINYNDLFKHQTYTTRFSNNSNEILKVIKIYDEYRWQFLTKNN